MNYVKIALKKYCGESDATLFAPFMDHLKRLHKAERMDFLKKSLSHIARNEPYLARAFPFAYLIGNHYTLEELWHIDRNPEVILDLID